MQPEGLTDTADIIWNTQLLSTDAAPVKPLGRKRQIERLHTCLAPMRNGETPLNVWLHGPPGSGKTTVARWVASQTCGSGTRVWIHVNCWQHRTFYSVLQAVIDQLKILRAEAQDANLKLERIRQAFRGRTALIVLDEIDRPMPQDREEIIYGLLGLPKTGLVCIANSLRAFAMLDERAKSRLSPVFVEAPAYSVSEIAEILSERARLALAPHSWSRDFIRRIAEASAGDARAAIQALRQAAAAAEELGRAKLEVRFIDDTLRRWQAIHQEARLATLSEHERIIYQLAVEHAPVGTTQLRQLYAAYCNRHHVQPMARRTFSSYLRRLSGGRLLTVMARSRGPGGAIVRPVSG